MFTNIQKWGNSQGIRIPKNILEEANLSNNDTVNIIVQDKKIVIEKVAQQRKNIKELFANYHEVYNPIQIDWGKTEGKEIW